MNGRMGHVEKINDDGIVYVKIIASEHSAPAISIGLSPEKLQSIHFSSTLNDQLSKLKRKWNSLLVKASGEGDLYIVNETVSWKRSKVELDDHDNEKKGTTPLHAASAAGHVNVIEWFLKSGAKVNAVDSRGRLAIHHAAKRYAMSQIILKISINLAIFFRGQTAAMKLLVEMGPDLLNIMTIKRLLTPLQKAVAKQHVGCAKVLIDNGCDVNLAVKIHQSTISQ